MRIVLAAALVAATLGFAAPAQAQSGLEGRVGKLESEMRAVQRKVFPGGAGMTVEPQITAPQAPIAEPGTPAGGGLVDLTARVSALEAGVRNVTGQVEQANYRVRQLEEAFNAYKTATDARLKALEGGGVPAGDAPAVGGPAEAAPPPVTPTRPAASAGADPARAAAAGIERPKTGDEAEDGYVYGYRLWQAKLYPEAEAALKTVADKFPKHRRASYAQNLLGRAYLDEGKPNLATLAFYDSYKKFPDGERAPDSLFYLAQALVQLKKPADACKVYSELSSVYAGKITTAMAADIAKGRAAAKCQ
ncbi:tetratricopeptide repeat protein [Sphingomonas cannabina]|uniref:tetratricopeptide repeat protein n=1 Tax=Sphingomonas cannabina TaxID=2899123 RepID=UPI001F3EF17D|nr:tetratricopeptide repeat protein [Sphingomonas cannabina]UIJ45490.1 tetratricopeptide repeat protein [Sphingomonas cannabina]